MTRPKSVKDLICDYFKLSNEEYINTMIPDKLERYMLYGAMIDYNFTGAEPSASELSDTALMLFNLLKGRIKKGQNVAKRNKENGNKSKGAPKGNCNNKGGYNQYKHRPTEPTEDTDELTPEVVAAPPPAETTASDKEFINNFKAQIYQDDELLQKLLQVCGIGKAKLKCVIDDVFTEWEIKGGNVAEVWTQQHFVNHVCKKARSKATDTQNRRYREEQMKQMLGDYYAKHGITDLSDRKRDYTKPL